VTISVAYEQWLSSFLTAPDDAAFLALSFVVGFAAYLAICYLAGRTTPGQILLRGIPQSGENGASTSAWLAAGFSLLSFWVALSGVVLGAISIWRASGLKSPVRAVAVVAILISLAALLGGLSSPLTRNIRHLDSLQNNAFGLLLAFGIALLVAYALLLSRRAESSRTGSAP